ncbi:molybdopterin-dependent oxidoreductase [Methylobacterium haplocladii]|uniref:Sulfite oxidase n=1 Tax=Methylobacterium haplocladii TaxID=1176176 RepID=A0A512INI4_9HYPH|nr:molybdopterin-dependent oxidoreductase [Methylobacterium haplocladii]GEO99271.1 sulfite oxidase [Methylobacterium haplocladii]GJD83528.1 Protein-methionine-sulfoxide reductase catalytic subunit MsrP [Methylobacterium haplocladii]GLS59440.1 sulfite oxidase [Methylobacterium haplocladii]
MLGLFQRKDRLIVHGEAPYNAEPPLDRLRAAFLTDQADFYVRSHGDIPDLDADDYRLTVGGMVATPLELSLADLKERFEPVTVTAVMQCAGNRRADMLAVAPVSGDPWAPGAIGNAEWTGVRLADVLQAAGCEAGEERHVAFESHDRIAESDTRFGASIPLAKALAPETLLAFAMNGAALAPEHGHPLRVVVPGFAGIRSPKWLARITVQDQPSDNPMQADDYKLFPPGVTAETADPAAGHTIEAMPLNSAICEPARGAALKAGRHSIRGYAIASDRAVARVDVSPDGGRSWAQARIEHDRRAPFAWTFWEIDLDLGTGEHELAVRAWDSAGQTQPAAPDDTWNYKGYLSAAWHRVRVTVA